jgi:hypothetical protein
VTERRPLSESVEAVDSARGDPDVGKETLRFVPVEEFARRREEGAEPLARASDGGSVIAADGTVLMYGDGGAGKTTAEIDLLFALAKGRPWLGLVEPDRPLGVAVIENEGPRPEFRAKLNAKLDYHGRDALEGRLVVLEEPWGGFSFADAAQRRALSAAMVELDIDLLVVGPLVTSGEFPDGGTPHEVARFEELLREVRELAERPLAVMLIHHENRAGRVSGAFQRLPDLLVHVTAEGNGRTRLYWEKSRWSSALHGTVTHLQWADGETFTVERRPDVTEATIADDILRAVRIRPGESWTKQRDALDEQGERVIRGGAEDVKTVRDQLIADGSIVNTSARRGGLNLWPADDPAATRSDAGTASERLPFAPPDRDADTVPFTVPRSIENEGTGTGTNGGTGGADE